MGNVIDYHIHTILSDGYATHEEMIQAAIEKGLDEIGFSDHICLKPVEWAMRMEDIPVMTSQIIDLKQKYSGQIAVRYGIEVDYFPDMEDDIAELIKGIPLDYVIGSVHFIGNWNFDMDQSLYGKWTNDVLYSKYFALVQQLAKSGLFDIVGHLDIIKKFRIYPETNQEALFEETLDIIKHNNLVVELNTGGFDRPCQEFTPSPKLLEMCFRHQIPVTLSSDAHRTSQIARYYDLAFSLLKHTGYSEIAAFQNRVRRFVRL